MKIKITIIQEVPDNIPLEDVTEWVYFLTHYSCGIGLDNPLVDEEFEPDEVAYEKI